MIPGCQTSLILANSCIHPVSSATHMNLRKAQTVHDVVAAYLSTNHVARNA